jgi:hypothetical protein
MRPAVSPLAGGPPATRVPFYFPPGGPARPQPSPGCWPRLLGCAAGRHPVTELAYLGELAVTRSWTLRGSGEA